MKKIRLLDENTINQIAAGEVIESSASVVKELLDNALDSGASHIQLKTEAMIAVIDNGCGIKEAELPLALTRHATSKLSQLEDLLSISSQGFRGEALPSIASVSKMRIHSCESGAGAEVVVEGGIIVQQGMLPRKMGTTIEVRDLFYNVPVRKKFQKSRSSENSAIHREFTKLALAHTDRAFSWKSFDFQKDESLLVRIEQLLGTEFASDLVEVDQEDGECALRGYLGSSRQHRPNRTGQYLFLNKRPIYSPFVAAKILEGFGTRLPLHRFPLFVLHLDVPLEWVDVNVHPTKREVRLSHEKELGRFVERAVERSLQSVHTACALPPISFSLPEEPRVAYTAPSFQVPQERPMTEMAEPMLPLSSVQPLTILAEYLVIEKEGGLQFVHLTRVHERLIFERVSKSEKLASQRLLLPYHLEFVGAEKELLLGKLEELEKLGIAIKPFGGHTFVVDEIPAIFDEGDIKELVLGLLTEEAPARVLSSHVKKRKYTIVEGKQLLEQLMKCEVSHETPRGEPIFSMLSREELEGRF